MVSMNKFGSGVLVAEISTYMGSLIDNCVGLDCCGLVAVIPPGIVSSLDAVADLAWA